MKVVGLTSKANSAFTKQLVLYDEVMVYQEIEDVVVGKDGWIYVDVAGREDVNKRVVNHFGGAGQLVANIALGFTNLSPSAPSSSESLPQWSTNTFEGKPSSTSCKIVQEGFFMGIVFACLFKIYF